MRTLKKTLSLVLVLAMVCSFFVMGTSAAFEDAADIEAQYAEATQVMYDLGIINGMGNGNFAPDATLTRAQAAQMIVKMLGAEELAKSAACTFEDVPATAWYRDAIAYCQSIGVVEGYGNGKVGPNDLLTGYQFALMLLRAVGYETKHENWISDQWQLCTVKLAKLAGLVEDLDDITAETFTREMAAGMAFDALMTVGQVTYTGGVTTTINGVTVTTGATRSAPGRTLYADTFRGAVALGIVKSNGAVADIENTVVLPATTTAGKITALGADTAFAVETDADELGRVVYIYYKNALNADGEYPVYSMSVVSSDVAVAQTITGAGSTAKAVTAFGATTTAAATGLSFTANYANAGTIVAGAPSFALPVNDTGSVVAGTYVKYAGEVVGYIAPSVSDIVKVTVTAVDADKGYYTVDDGVVTYVNVEATAANCVDVVVYDGEIDWFGMLEAPVADADTALAVYKVTQSGAKYIFEDVATVEGKVTLIGSNKISVDGVSYDVVADAASAAAIEDSFTVFTTTNLDFTNTFKFFLDQNGKIFAGVKLTTAASDTNKYELAYVIGTKEVAGATDKFGATSYTHTVQYYTLDGALKTANYASFAGKTVVNNPGSDATKIAYASADDEAKGWMMVAETEAGAAVRAIAAADGYTATTKAVAEGSAIALTAASTKFDTYLLNSESVFLYSTATALAAANTDATAVKGAHATTIGFADDSNPGTDLDITVELVYAKNASNENLNDLVAAWVGHARPASTTAAPEVVYVVAENGQLSGGDVPTYSYTVIGLDGSVESNFVSTTTGAGAGWKQITRLSDGRVELGAATTTGYVQAIDGLGTSDVYTSNGVKYMVETNEYVVTNAVVVDIRDAVLAGTAEAITSVDKMVGETLTATAYYTTAVGTGIKTVSVIIITGPNA